MTLVQMVNFLSDEPADQIAALLAERLNVPSPLVGARGPTDPGPERPFVQALKEVDDTVKEKFGAAVNTLLLQEVLCAGQEEDAIARPLLMFNLLALVETVPLSPTRPALGALKAMRGPLERALRDRGENLYRQALLALAANQADSPESDLWTSLLQSENAEYVGVAEAGLCNAGFEVACKALPQIKSAHERHPELGAFEGFVMVLIDSYPNASWPDCAQELLAGSENSEEVLGPVEKWSQGRHEQPLTEVERPDGSAIDDLARRPDTHALDKAQEEHSRWRRNPADVLCAA